MTHEDYKELLAANALTALDGDAARALNTHLERCADCRSEMTEWQNTAALLVFETPAADASPQLRERILAAVRAEGVTEVSDTPGYNDAARSASSGVSSVLPFEKPRRNVWTSLGSLGAIAASLLVVGLLVTVFMLWRQNRSAQTELAQLSVQAQEAKAQLARERAIVALLSSPGARMTELAGTNAAPGAHAMLAYDKNGHAMLMARGLPAAPVGKAYQLWFIKDNQKMPGKMFTTDAQGNGSLEDQIPAVALGSAVFAITLEPASGVQAPTGAIYLVSSS